MAEYQSHWMATSTTWCFTQVRAVQERISAKLEWSYRTQLTECGGKWSQQGSVGDKDRSSWCQASERRTARSGGFSEPKSQAAKSVAERWGLGCKNLDSSPQAWKVCGKVAAGCLRTEREGMIMSFEQHMLLRHVMFAKHKEGHGDIFAAADSGLSDLGTSSNLVPDL